MKLPDQILFDLANAKDIRFPELPDVLLRVNQVLNDPWLSDRELAAAITSPTLIVRLLQIANSPALGTQRKVESVERAVTILGRTMVRNIVVCVSMRDLFSCKDLDLAIKLKHLWRHNAEIASVAVLLAKSYQVSKDSALVGSLLHEIGMLPIISYFESNQIKADLLESVPCAIPDRFGKELLEKWEFPSTIIQAVGAHGLPDHDGKTVSDLVAAAHYLVDSDEQRLQRIGLGVEEFTKLVESQERQEILNALV